jgi:hypothetical protein
MTRAVIVAKTLSRSGREPSRRLLREHSVRGTDAELDAVVLEVLVADGWIVEPVDRGKATTSVAYRNARKLRDRQNTWLKSNAPAFWDKPRRGAS